jgi:D-alanine-D-alanine ligase
VLGNPKSVKFDTIKGEKNLHIALVKGGLSAEREVSLVSAKSVLQALVNLGYTVTPIDMGRDIAKVLKEVNPNLVFNCLHGRYGEDGCLPGILEVIGIPYTHSGLAASAIGMDKYLSRQMFLYHGLDCPSFILLHDEDPHQEEPFERPFVVKPLNEGSSIGVEIVKKDDKFNIKEIKFPENGRLLVEKYIKGREIHIAVINGKAIGAVEIKPFNEFYDYEAKYSEGKAEHLMPALLNEELMQRAFKVAETAYRAIGCKGIARLDTIYSEDDDKFYVLEINTHPGMTNLSLVPEIANYYGINFEQLMQLIIDDALVNGQNNQRFKKAI